MQEFTFNYSAFMGAVQSLVVGSWDYAQGESWLQQAQACLEGEAQQVLELAESGYMQESPQEMELGWNGVQAYQAAVELLWDYLENGQEDSLEQAVAAAEEARENLTRAQQLNADISCELTFEAYC